MILSMFRRKPSAAAAPAAEDALVGALAGPAGEDALAGAAAAPVAEPESDAVPQDEAQLFARIQDGYRAHMAGDLEGALEIFQDLSYSHGEDSRVKTGLGICKTLLGEHAQAHALLGPVCREERSNIDALKFYAISCSALGDVLGALGVIEAAIEASPKDPELYVVAGDIYLGAGIWEQAAEQYRRASDARPEWEIPLHRLECVGMDSETRTGHFEKDPSIAERRRAIVARMQQELADGELGIPGQGMLLALLAGTPETFPQAVDMALAAAQRPPTVELETGILRTLSLAGRFDELLPYCERAFAENPEKMDRFVLGALWVASGAAQWNSGWRMMCEVTTIARHYHHQHGVPIWEGQKIGSQKLLVYQDQGVGDVILCLRLLPILRQRGIRFDLWVQPPLQEYARQLPYCERSIETPRLPDAATHGCVNAITFFGLFSALYLGLDELRDPPRIAPQPEHAPELRAGLRRLPGLRVGLLYGGNPRRRDDFVRTVPVAEIRRLLAVAGVSWVNLMVDQRDDKAEVLEAFAMHDPMPRVRTFHDTAAIVEELDAVVTVDASVAHVAGNLRKPTWVLVPPMRDWRWQIGDTMGPWWPTARVFRCDAPGVWTEAVGAVLTELQRFVEARQDAPTLSASPPA